MINITHQRIKSSVCSENIIISKIAESTSRENQKINSSVVNLGTDRSLSLANSDAKLYACLVAPCAD